MASALAVFGRNDLRGIRREPLLIGVLCAPLGWIALLRLGVPPVEEMVQERYGVDLVPYYPVILTAFLLLTSPVVIGGLAALLILDERDGRTLSALRVSPVSLGRFASYRAGMAMVITVLYTVGTMYGSGMLPADQLAGLSVVGISNGWCAVLFALLIVSIASNKVEGLAVLRGFAIVLAGLPLVAYFVPAHYDLFFGVIPTYWPAKAYWLVAEGGPWWWYVIAGLAYNGVLAIPLYRRFRRGV
ncbi:fluoroquinolone transport system permease protein [Tamaricihabitans halophyticus]|uniref:Fluoroquinolone transport system permease protein n=1 Tax=Tamaricihabitans halophyticus TaxID=1262583 RepID=A0A4V2ST94_9PSEU|nr:ABC transporter permease [Tamaricihabitans halophyticus]TCP49956.1 fluoroquinolone transport system permease protein [Tamaricihabitans halophyticus]